MRPWVDAAGREVHPYARFPAVQIILDNVAMIEIDHVTYDLSDALKEQNARMRAADLPED